MKYLLILIYILSVSTIHAQKKVTWIVEGGPNISWSTKTKGPKDGLLTIKPSLGGCLNIFVQYAVNNKLYLETGFGYKMTQYWNNINYVNGNIFLGKGAFGGLLFPALALGTERYISQKSSITGTFGSAMELYRPTGVFYFSLAQDSSNYLEQKFTYDYAKNYYLFLKVGLLKKKNEFKNFELQLCYVQGLTKTEVNTIIVYEKGKPAREYESIYRGTFLSLQFRYYLGRKTLPTKPE